MPRIRRASPGGYCQHAINRGNRRERVFRDDEDYQRFVTLVGRALERTPIRLLAWCLMPNHFHFVAWPENDGDLSRWMHWLLTTHVRWSHLRYGTSGRIWQGRFKAFPIQEDLHLLTVMRYVERNPVRAQLVGRAEHWPWSSLGAWSRGDGSLLTEGPVVRWNGWVQHVNTPQTRAEIDATRICVQRETPFGDRDWTATTARRLGLERSLRRMG